MKIHARVSSTVERAEEKAKKRLYTDDPKEKKLQELTKKAFGTEAGTAAKIGKADVATESPEVQKVRERLQGG